MIITCHMVTLCNGSSDLHCVPKKQYIKLMAITLSILNGFSNFFHCWKEK